MQEPRNSWAVVAKTNDSDSKAVPAVASVVVKELFRKATIASSVAASTSLYYLSDLPKTNTTTRNTIVQSKLSKTLMA